MKKRIIATLTLDAMLYMTHQQIKAWRLNYMLKGAVSYNPEAMQYECWLTE